MGLKTAFSTAFQPFVFRDGSLGAVWLGIHVRHGVVGLRVGKRTYCGNLLTGIRNCTRPSGPSSSNRSIHAEIVIGVIKNALAVCSNEQPRVALSSRISKRSLGGYCGRRGGRIEAIRASLTRICSCSSAIPGWLGRECLSDFSCQPS